MIGLRDLNGDCIALAPVDRGSIMIDECEIQKRLDKYYCFHKHQAHHLQPTTGLKALDVC